MLYCSCYIIITINIHYRSSFASIYWTDYWMFLTLGLRSNAEKAFTFIIFIYFSIIPIKFGLSYAKTVLMLFEKKKTAQGSPLSPTSLVLAPDQDGDSLQYNSSTSTIVSLNIKVKFLSFKSMWNTMECKRDRFTGALGGARESHWERISHALKNFDDYSQISVFAILAQISHTRTWTTSTLSIWIKLQQKILCEKTNFPIVSHG